MYMYYIYIYKAFSFLFLWHKGLSWYKFLLLDPACQMKASDKMKKQAVPFN